MSAKQKKIDQDDTHALRVDAQKTLDGSVVLVCGGLGFIGSNFIHMILDKYPKVKVVNVDALTYSGNLDNVNHIESDPRYTFVRGDIADQETMSKVFKQHSPDFVINFAAETHVDRSIHVGALEFIKTNVHGVFNLLEEVKKSDLVRRFVQVSTDEVYGSLDLDAGEPFKETTAFAPNVPYAATKAGGDMLCRSYHNTWKVPVVVTHCSNNYGPRQYPEKLIPFFVQRILEGKKLPLYGDGHHVRDWIYVEDHCKALELCLLAGAPGAVYNIGADCEMSNREIALRILDYFGQGEDQLEFVPERPGHDRRYAIDSSYIRRELGWKPTRNFTESFHDTITWYVKNQEWTEKVRKKTGVFNPHIDLWKAHEIEK